MLNCLVKILAPRSEDEKYENNSLSHSRSIFSNNQTE